MGPGIDIQTIIIGAGVIGLAIARQLSQAGHEVIILESENSIGHHTSGRNSQVIHAGMYYPPGSRRARLCIEGRAMLYDFCKSRHVGHEMTGKLIVATSPEQSLSLSAIHSRGLQNGVDDLRLIKSTEAVSLEPSLYCKGGAIHSPSTGIIDASAYMMALLGESESAGATIVYHAPVSNIQVKQPHFIVSVDDETNTEITCKNLINAAGHGGWALARQTEGLDNKFVPPQYLAKGSYFSLSGNGLPFQHLIYPVPQDKSLGVHYVRDLGGQASFGPDLELLNDNVLDYRVDEAKKEKFIAAIKSFWPDIEHHTLQPGTSGIRPRISAPDDPVADFVIQTDAVHGIKNLVNLFGIESPGLTSSLAIAKLVATNFKH